MKEKDESTSGSGNGGREDEGVWIGEHALGHINVPANATQRPAEAVDGKCDGLVRGICNLANYGVHDCDISRKESS